MQIGHMELRERAGWTLAGAGVFSLLEAFVGLSWPAQGVAYAWGDLPGSLLGWLCIGGLLSLPRHGERVAAGVLLAIALPALLGSPWWALLGVLGALLPRVGLAAFAGLGLVSALGHPRIARPAVHAPELPGLVLITVDTVRFDHGQRLLDAAPSQAVSAAPWTLPSMDSVMLSQSAVEHGGGRQGEAGTTRPEGRRLAQRLGEQGYVSSAWVCNPHLREELGFAQGFDSFVHADSWRDPVLLRALIDERLHRGLGRTPSLWRARDQALIDGALLDVQQGMKGRFLWLHILGPHEYLRDPASASQDPAALYEQAVDRAGAQLDPLLAALPPGTRVLVMSDHGESLGEDGLWGHGTALSDPQLLVPAWVLGTDLVLPTPAPAWRLPAFVFEGDPLRQAERVPVTGIRADPYQAAIWTPQGYEPLELAPDAALPELDLRSLGEQLEALGYQELGRDSLPAPESSP